MQVAFRDVFSHQFTFQKLVGIRKCIMNHLTRLIFIQSGH